MQVLFVQWMLLVSLQLGRNMWDRGILFSYRKRITQFSYKWNPRAKNADPLNPSRLFGGGGLSTFMQFYCGAWPGTIRHCQVIVKNHCCTVSIYDASSVCRRSLSFLLVEDSLIMIRCRRYAYSSTCSHPRGLFPCIVYTYVCVQHPSTAKPHCFIRHVRSSLLVRLTYAFQYGNGFVVAKNCIVQYRKPGPVQQNKCFLTNYASFSSEFVPSLRCFNHVRKCFPSLGGLWHLLWLQTLGELSKIEGNSRLSKAMKEWGMI